MLGLKTFDDYDLEELIERIDWTPFFMSWQLAGKYPKILDDKVVGEAARNLFEDAKVMLRKLVEEKRVQARGVIGLWPANSVDDDVIEVYADESRSDVVERLFHIRQQTTKGRDGICYSLADFIAPKRAAKLTGLVVLRSPLATGLTSYPRPMRRPGMTIMRLWCRR